jgi:hypothetical protein
MECLPTAAFHLQKEEFLFCLAGLCWVILRINGNRPDHAVESANGRESVPEFSAVGWQCLFGIFNARLFDQVLD